MIAWHSSKCLVTSFMIYFDMQVEGIQVHANEGGVTQTRGGAYWLILPAGCNTLSPHNIIPEHDLQALKLNMALSSSF